MPGLASYWAKIRPLPDRHASGIKERAGAARPLSPNDAMRYGLEGSTLTQVESGSKRVIAAARAAVSGPRSFS